MKSILHIINKASLRCHSVSQLQSLTSPKDAVLFLEDGVYNALNTQTNLAVTGLVGGRIYTLLPDLQARGFTRQDLIGEISVIDYEQFVDLSLDYELVWSW